jgi:hypothetical protein
MDFLYIDKGTILSSERCVLCLHYFIKSDSRDEGNNDRETQLEQPTTTCIIPESYKFVAYQRKYDENNEIKLYKLAACNHVFHVECIEGFLRGKEIDKKCPICRVKIERIFQLTIPGLERELYKHTENNQEKILKSEPKPAGWSPEEQLLSFDNLLWIPSFEHTEKIIFSRSTPSQVFNDFNDDLSKVTFDTNPGSRITYLGLPSFNQPLKQGDIPSFIGFIAFKEYNHPLIPGAIPDSVITLILDKYNQPLIPRAIPNSVGYLNLGKYNHRLIPGAIPNSVGTLTLAEYEQPLIPGAIPDSVVHLTLDKYNQPLNPGDIPNSVTNLTLNSYNQPLKPGDISDFVRILTLNSYNQSLKPGDIPASVRILTLNSYNQSLKSDAIPASVRVLGPNFG